MAKFNAWLWPDHVAGKREMRRLREEHNALLSSHIRLMEVLNGARRALRGEYPWSLRADTKFTQREAREAALNWIVRTLDAEEG